MKILLTGANGQVGYELERSLKGLGTVIAPRRAQLDLSNLDQLRQVVRQTMPDLIVNPAAYTAVDRAESDREVAMRVNAEAPAVLAKEALAIGAKFVHFSTDYVFDGSKEGAYVEADVTEPKNVYGESKFAGEEAIRASGVQHLIFRTSWVYGNRGGNFLLTMLRLAKERPELRIVADQFGAPTWCRTIADSTAMALHRLCMPHMDDVVADPAAWRRVSGTYHLTSGGKTTWYEFAQEIFTELPKTQRPVLVPISTSEYPVPAVRPRNSSLDCSRFISTFGNLPDWKDALRMCRT
jgi:dTDP-4-dehydrorhamnose reductase